MVQLVILFLETISPSVRKAFVDAVKPISAAAAKSQNPRDKILVSVLKTLLNIKD